jgi:hypothetical protein
MDKIQNSVMPISFSFDCSIVRHSSAPVPTFFPASGGRFYFLTPIVSRRQTQPLDQNFTDQVDGVHPSFANLPSSPNPFSQNRRRGTGFKVPLPLWERDLG